MDYLASVKEEGAFELALVENSHKIVSSIHRSQTRLFVLGAL